uniref:Uncharacterized protein n=1 Tax=Arundo donax TaxID=35708 RepID=A0A0A9AN16_ARUDO
MCRYILHNVSSLSVVDLIYTTTANSKLHTSVWSMPSTSFFYSVMGFVENSYTNGKGQAQSMKM